jgi:putative Mn2+ efflux pump MntP
MKRFVAGKAIAIAAAFGVFQALMPLFGYLLGTVFAEAMRRFDHNVAFALLGIIGGKMLYCGVRGFRGPEKNTAGDSLSLPGLLLQAIATSIDALIIGIGFIAMGMTWDNIFAAVIFIGAATFVLSFIGVAVGKKFGEILGAKAEIVGGMMLIGIGVKVFAEHMFFGG